MRHQIKGHKIGRSASHRKATLAALSTSLIEHKRITTTYPKARALRVFVEPIIHRAKEDSQHNRRQVFRRLQDKNAVSELFGEIAGKIADRPGGYTRIIKLGRRQGDGAELAVIELVDYNDIKPDGSSTNKKKSTRRGRRKKSGGAAAAAATAGAAAAVTDDAPVTEEAVEAAVEEAPAAEEVVEAVAEEAPAAEEVVEAVAEEAPAAEEVVEAAAEEAPAAEEVVEAAAEEAPAAEEAVEAVAEEAPVAEAAGVAAAAVAADAVSEKAPAERLQIESLEGIGPAYGQRFRGMDIEFVDELLEKGKDADGRASIAETTNFPAEKIEQWVTAADLFRVEGVDGDAAELMQASGITNVQSLASQDAAALVAKMAEVNDSGEKKIAPDGPPSEEQAAAWIATAKSLDQKLSI